MEEAQSNKPTGNTLTPWEPQRYLRRVSAQQVKFARGFLRCRPERWFPGFAAQWLPLAHSLGIELRIVEVQPFMGVPRGLDHGYCATVDGEAMAILLDIASAKVLRDAFVPGAPDSSHPVMIEYLARRLLSSLALSWSGPQASAVRFGDEGADFVGQVPHDEDEVGHAGLQQLFDHVGQNGLARHGDQRFGQRVGVGPEVGPGSGDWYDGFHRCPKARDL